MAEKEYIEREAAIAAAFTASAIGNSAYRDVYDTVNRLRLIPAADVAPVVRCKECKHYVPSEYVNGKKMCVRDADWSVEDGCYYGFTSYPEPDFFCADGAKLDLKEA